MRGCRELLLQFLMPSSLTSVHATLVQPLQLCFLVTRVRERASERVCVCCGLGVRLHVEATHSKEEQ